MRKKIRIIKIKGVKKDKRKIKIETKKDIFRMIWVNLNHGANKII